MKRVRIQKQARSIRRDTTNSRAGGDRRVETVERVDELLARIEATQGSP
ncbi:MAG: hypothetical protein ACRDJ5_00970 [Actinomycetota bacterium]